VDAASARRLILCSGKVYYDLVQAREEHDAHDVAIVRLEQLYPLRTAEVRETLAPYRDGLDLVWVQEEPWNMGGWFFISSRLPRMIEGRLPLRVVAREESASPATGSHASHLLEQRRLLDSAFGE
jgi:2-oxoglutarate dehydrogenase E1 component